MQQLTCFLAPIKFEGPRFGISRHPFDQCSTVDKISIRFCLVSFVTLGANIIHAQEEGLATKYPKDAGIGRDKAVLFHD